MQKIIGAYVKFIEKKVQKTIGAIVEKCKKLYDISIIGAKIKTRKKLQSYHSLNFLLRVVLYEGEG